MKEIAFFPPVLLLEGESPLTSITNALDTGETSIIVRELTKGEYTDIPYRRDPALLRHKYRLEIGNSIDLHVQPTTQGDTAVGVIGEHGEYIPSPEPTVIFIAGQHKTGQRRLVGITSPVEEGALFLHSILLNNKRSE